MSFVFVWVLSFFGGVGCVCVLFITLAACVLQLYSRQVLRWFMFPGLVLGPFCRWHIRLTLQTFHIGKLQTHPFLTVTVSTILVLYRLNSFIWSSLFHVP